MKKICAIAIMLVLLVNLAALSIETPGQEKATCHITELRALPLEQFETTRVKGIESVSDIWRGIALLAWLDQQQDYFWHELEFVSVDGHKLRLHRADLVPRPVWLALSDAKGWLEEGIRLVFPGQRDNIWIRGLDRIILHGFTPHPAPRRIYSWDDIKVTHSSDGIIMIADLIGESFSEEKGELLMVSSELQPLVLKYPEHLEDGGLCFAEDQLKLCSEILPSALQLNSLIYLQMGHQAIILPQALKLLPELAKLLNWPELTVWKTVEPSYRLYVPGTVLPRDNWLERD